MLWYFHFLSKNCINPHGPLKELIALFRFHFSSFCQNFLIFKNVIINKLILVSILLN